MSSQTVIHKGFKNISERLDDVFVKLSNKLTMKHRFNVGKECGSVEYPDILLLKEMRCRYNYIGEDYSKKLDEITNYLIEKVL